MKSLSRLFIILIVLSLSTHSFAIKTKDGVVTLDPTSGENVYSIYPESTKYYDYLDPLYRQGNLNPQLVNLDPFLITDPFNYTKSVPQPDTTIPIVVIPATMDTEQTSQLSKAAVKDLNIMCRLFDIQLQLPSPVSTDPFSNIYNYYRSDQYQDPGVQSFWGRKTRNTDCIYIQGYGALFFMRVNLSLTAPPPPVKPKEKPSEPVDKVWHQIKRDLYGPRNVNTDQSGRGIDRVEWLKTNIVKNLRHAANIKCLKPDELVIVTANGNEKEAGTPKVLIVRAKKSDIDAFSEGTLDLDGFREKVQIVAPPRAKSAGDSEQATDKPDTAEATEE
ncbi:MAG: hypothetical protein ACYS67_01690 [Planctomycetota bacterium]|jgi:hypothetical protein